MWATSATPVRGILGAVGRGFAWGFLWGWAGHPVAIGRKIVVEWWQGITKWVGRKLRVLRTSFRGQIS